jgi:hypothetical protein
MGYTTWTPTFKLYDSTGGVLLYTFPVVQSTNLPQTPSATITVTNLRSKGAVVIGGGTKPFEESLHFWLVSDNYTDLMALITSMYTVIPINTPLILQMDTSPIAVIQYHVKRIDDFQWTGIDRDFRLYRQEVTLKLLCNAW